MITQEQILLYLNSDNWFRQSHSRDKIKIKDNNGKNIEVARSYYHVIKKSAKIIIRVSEHGTYLNTWIKASDKPTESLQNLSIVFSNKPICYRRETEPEYKLNKDGVKEKVYQYFVIEQYQYRLDTLSYKDFIKVIKQLKNLEINNVFTDPLKTKTNKRASRKVLTPTDAEGNDIPSSNNIVHPIQTVVASNPDNEVDKDGNIIEKKIREIIKEELTKSEVSSMISDKLSSYIKKYELERKVKEIVKDVMDSFFKMMYNKRGFWKNNL